MRTPPRLRKKKLLRRQSIGEITLDDGNGDGQDRFAAQRTTIIEIKGELSDIAGLRNSHRFDGLDRDLSDAAQLFGARSGLVDLGAFRQGGRQQVYVNLARNTKGKSEKVHTTGLVIRAFMEKIAGEDRDADDPQDIIITLPEGASRQKIERDIREVYPEARIVFTNPDGEGDSSEADSTGDRSPLRRVDSREFFRNDRGSIPIRLSTDADTETKTGGNDNRSLFRRVSPRRRDGDVGRAPLLGRRTPLIEKRTLGSLPLDISNWQTVMSTAAFKDATKRLGKRSDAYHKLVKALDSFHKNEARLLRSLISNVEDIQREIRAIGERKQLFVQEILRLRRELKGVKQSIKGTQAFLLREQNREITTDNKKDIEAKIAQFEEDLEKHQRNRGLLLERMQFQAGTLRQIDAEIDRLQDQIRQQIDDNHQILIEHGREVFQLGRKFSQDKGGGSTSTRIKRATDLLLRQLQNPGGVLLDVLHNTLGAPFRHQPAQPLLLLNSDTASDVYLVHTRSEIGRSGTNRGYAKRALLVGELRNDTTQVLDVASNLDNFQLLEPPNLIARQVCSFRLDQALQAGVIATEVFSRDETGHVIGITADVSPLQQAMVDISEDVQAHRHFPFNLPNLQRNLANLQLMDALIGQKDRHLGNIFIDPLTGQVMGIDNDMAFPHRKDHFEDLGANELTGQFSVEEGELKYLPKLIDAEMARAVMALTPAALRKILSRQEGDPEGLSEGSIEAAVLRLEAIQRRIEELADRLITNWDDNTYAQAVNDGTIGDGGFNNIYSNYLARLVGEYSTALEGANPAKQVMGQGK